MTNKLKKRLALILSFALALAFIPAQPAMAASEVCENVDLSELYSSLGEALADINLDDGHKIIMYEDIVHEGSIQINDMCFTFDLNGTDLVIQPATSSPAPPILGVTNGALVLEDTSAGGGGTLDVVNSTDGGVALNADNGNVEVTNVFSSEIGVKARNGAEVIVNSNVEAETLPAPPSSGPRPVGVDAYDSTVTVGGNVTARGYSGRGVDAGGAYTTVTVGGNVSGDGIGLQAEYGATVDVGGNVSGGDSGVFADGANSTVTVVGSVVGDAAESAGVVAVNGASVDVGESVTGNIYGVLAYGENTAVTVGGDVTGADLFGIEAGEGAVVTVGPDKNGKAVVAGGLAGVAVSYDAEVTVNGEIETGEYCYILLGVLENDEPKMIFVDQNGDGYYDIEHDEYAGNFILETTTKTGYITYYFEDGDSTVWVKDPNYVPPSSGGYYPDSSAAPTPPPTSATGAQSPPNPATKTTKIGKLIVTTPWDYDPVFDEDGNVTLPEGITVELPGKVFLEVPLGTKIANDEHQSLSFPKGGGGTITPNNSGFTFKLHEDAVVLFDEDAPLGYKVSIDNPFTDMDDDAWYSEYLLFAYAHGLITGTGTNPMQMSPNMPTTQNMVLTILYRMAGSPDETGEGEWYADAVKWAAENGIADSGGPDAPIERQDLAVILMRFAELMGLEFNEPNEYPGFGDSDDVKGDEEQKAIELLYKAGVINGKPGGVFDPQGEATRAELAAMLMRFLEAVVKK